MAETLSHPVWGSLGMGMERMRRVTTSEQVWEVLAGKMGQLLKSCEL